MCLGIPGKITEVYLQEGTRMGKVDFNGVTLEACLEATPEANPGDYVIIHAGFAISVLSEAEALETLQLLSELESFQDEMDNK